MEQKSVVYITASIMVTGLTSNSDILLVRQVICGSLSEIVFANQEVDTQDIKRNQPTDEVALVCREALSPRKDRQRLQR